MNRWVFAYGSNMHLGDLERWFLEHSRPAPEVHEAVSAVLPGWRLVWNHYAQSRRGGAANIEPHSTSRLPGVALFVDEPTYEGIAAKEDHPIVYDRCDVELELSANRRVTATTYFVPPQRCRPYEPPTRAYLDLLISGAEAHGLPAEHLATLRSTPVR